MADKVHYGGQAIIEGVMIRGKNTVASAIRHPEGHIVVHTEQAIPITSRYRWLSLPFLRGTPALLDSLRIGFKALIFSADVAIEAEGEKPPSRLYYAATMIGALAFGIGVFVLLPSLAMQPLHEKHSFLLNIAEGLIRMLFFLGYVWLISRWANIRRIFEYHGAEHMVINAFEAGRPIAPKEAEDFDTVHVRCGSSFIMLFLVIAILVHAFFGWPVWYWRLASRILLLPVIAGLAYEMMKLAASPKAFWLTKVVTSPGLWLQRLTTRRPHPDQVEVAIAALNAVLAEEMPAAKKAPAAPAPELTQA